MGAFLAGFAAQISDHFGTHLEDAVALRRRTGPQRDERALLTRSARPARARLLRSAGADRSSAGLPRGQLRKNSASAGASVEGGTSWNSPGSSTARA